MHRPPEMTRRNVIVDALLDRHDPLADGGSQPAFRQLGRCVAGLGGRELARWRTLSCRLDLSEVGGGEEAALGRTAGAAVSKTTRASGRATRRGSRRRRPHPPWCPCCGGDLGRSEQRWRSVVKRSASTGLRKAINCWNRRLGSVGSGGGSIFWPFNTFWKRGLSPRNARYPTSAAARKGTQSSGNPLSTAAPTPAPSASRCQRQVKARGRSPARRGIDLLCSRGGFMLRRLKLVQQGAHMAD